MMHYWHLLHYNYYKKPQLSSAINSFFFVIIKRIIELIHLNSLYLTINISWIKRITESPSPFNLGFFELLYYFLYPHLKTGMLNVQPLYSPHIIVFLYNSFFELKCKYWNSCYLPYFCFESIWNMIRNL